jgi:hypothetical protein
MAIKAKVATVLPNTEASNMANKHHMEALDHPHLNNMAKRDILKAKNHTAIHLHHQANSPSKVHTTSNHIRLIPTILKLHLERKAKEV